MLFYGMGLVASIVRALLGGEFVFFADLMAIGFGLILLQEWWKWWTRPRRQLPIYGSGHAHAFEFADDEAMKALRLAVGFAQRPRDFLKWLFSTKAPPEYAVEPPQRPKFWKVFWADFRKTASVQMLAPSGKPAESMSPIRKFIQVVFNIFGIIIIIYIIMLEFFSYQPTASMKDTVHQIYKHMALVAMGLFATAGVTLIMMFSLRFLSTLYKFLKSGVAWQVHVFLQGPGAWIMGVVVRNAAFGGQCKKVLRPQELSEKERVRGETISDKLNQKMKDLSGKTAAQAGEALYFALAEGDALEIKKHIRERLTDPKLAHCQYYCEDEIINRIAELIASPPSSLTTGLDISKQNAVYAFGK